MEIKDSWMSITATTYTSVSLVFDGGNFALVPSSHLRQVQARFTEEDYKNAVADFHFMLMHKSQIDKQGTVAIHTCNKQIAAGKGSIYARCGHFGVAMHKVVSDEQGNCRMKTAVEREKMNPIEEGGASISSAKVFMS